MTRKKLTPYEIEVITKALRNYECLAGRGTAGRIADAFENSERVTIIFHAWGSDQKSVA